MYILLRDENQNIHIGSGKIKVYYKNSHLTFFISFSLEAIDTLIVELKLSLKDARLFLDDKNND
jgi:hypothetical protein